MKIKEGMVLREVADKYVVVPTGKAAKDFRKLIRLNLTGRDIWNGVAAGRTLHEIAEKMVQDYTGVTIDVAEKAAQTLVNQLVAAGIITTD